MISNRLLFISFISVSLLLTGATYGQVRISDIQRNSSNFCEWGVFTGGNFQQLSAAPFSNSFSNGNATGAYFKRRKKIFGIQAALSASTAHYETVEPLSHKYKLSHTVFTDTTSKGVFNAFYANLPVVVEVRPVKWLSLQMGLAYSYLAYTQDVNAVYKKNADVKKLFGKRNVSGVAGLEVELSPKLKIEATYSVGFMDLNNHDFQGLTDKWYTNSGTISMIWRLKKWYPPLKHIRKK